MPKVNSHFLPRESAVLFLTLRHLSGDSGITHGCVGVDTFDLFATLGRLVKVSSEGENGPTPSAGRALPVAARVRANVS